MTDEFGQATMILGALALGYGAGLVHFRSLHAVTRGLLAGNMRVLGLQAARIVALAVVLWVMARLGAGPLLAGALGILLARAQVLAGLRR